MNELQIFNYNDREIRTVEKNGDLWWVLKDVCDVLELSNPTMIAGRLDEDEKDIFKTKSDLALDIPNRGVSIINESGLYNVILRSDKPEAKKFKRWVTHEVLPSIRKHGAYMNEQTLEQALTSPDFLIRLAQELKSEKEARQRLEKQAAEDAPKVLFAKMVETAETSILIGDLAKFLKQNGINTGQNRLFEWMRGHGYLVKNGASRNMPTQRAMEMGLFEVKESTTANPDGTIRLHRTTKVTGKGQVYFIKRFLEVGV